MSDDELSATRAELEHARAERVQLETQVASLRDELTCALLERDNAIRDAQDHYSRAQRLVAERNALRRQLDSAHAVLGASAIDEEGRDSIERHHPL